MQACWLQFTFEFQACNKNDKLYVGLLFDINIKGETKMQEVKTDLRARFKDKLNTCGM